MEGLRHEVGSKLAGEERSAGRLCLSRVRLTVQDFREFLSYGATGVVAFVLVKWVVPLFNAIISRAHVESSIYGNAKDLIDYTNEQLKNMQSRYSELQERSRILEKELEFERERCRKLQIELEDVLDDDYPD